MQKARLHSRAFLLNQAAFSLAGTGVVAIQCFQHIGIAVGHTLKRFGRKLVGGVERQGFRVGWQCWNLPLYAPARTGQSSRTFSAVTAIMSGVAQIAMLSFRDMP
ncbi:hypothetical protein Oant_1176 [Brucella anthropi ATCC 49188]|uniref:Uncharacterized protein n=1 Tax=Brucella anthropi (strain ATCC 49188 / DSM 6882 / CCUG 24695 / JCM 21032 / LMG 3331 / NBRC 15819 / NCTC 12168 / Alc 37) TaxID=439375 RepID=A6WY40_BRUA4|nr:hypothetical protein Oant_1176 [Brucella anthropi ATCC 49188]